LTSFTNGQTAWEYLSGLAENETIETIGTKLAAVISDIEMPLLDGLALTKKIRGHQTLHQVPVILFSSIASDANLNKALQVGATEQFTKPKYGQLKKSLDSVFGLIKNDRRSQDS
ncbi:MAG: response regulator, partial [Pirellulaceae bacterium]|nr:response regulator [Pirellulaceae bacterium]